MIEHTYPALAGIVCSVDAAISADTTHSRQLDLIGFRQLTNPLWMIVPMIGISARMFQQPGERDDRTRCSVIVATSSERLSQFARTDSRGVAACSP